MGSLVAILSRSGPPDTWSARRMLAAAPHRGAAGDLRVCGNAVLGVSNAPNFVDSTISAPGPMTAVFSGKLDNASALTAMLSAAGCPPVSATNPADVVVSAFQALGPEAPNRFRGVFAGVLTDGQRMWSFRDHLGFQPLFFADHPRAFFAATEVKQVVAGAEIQRQPDTGVLEQIFYGRLRQDSPSAFKGVSRVPHASTLSVNGDGPPAARAYWHPRRLVETASVASFEDVQVKFDELFKQAVARCLTGEDVVSLSGGIDSPAVAGFAAPLYRQSNRAPLAALSLVFPDHPKVDERPHIEAVASFLGMQLHTFTSKARVLDDLVRWCGLLDGPIPSISAPQMHEFYLEARRLGYRNVLTGDIAECVADLPLHVAGHLLIRGRWKPLARLLSTEHRQGASLRKIGSWRNFASQLLMPFVPGRMARWYASVRGHDAPKRIPDWLDARTVNEVPYRTDLVPPGWARFTAVQTMPLEGCPITMEGVETCSAVAGVTVRRPFADVDLWEFFLSLPAEIKYPDLRTKTLLRRLLRGRVPDRILERRDKTYFDDHVMSQVDYPLLKQFLWKPDHRVRGVDYERLALRLERQDLTLIDWLWLSDLLRIHAFLKQW
ncbi:MAG: asparagine synthase-related protein [Vicinamibacterales bacterium]